MIPLLVQVPPPGREDAGQSARRVPLLRSTTRSCPPLKKPNDAPSGDQKGPEPPSVPSTRPAPSVSSARTHIAVVPVLSSATKASLAPSGESARPPSGRSSWPAGAANAEMIARAGGSLG